MSYERQTSFTDYQAAAPFAPMSGPALDAEFDNIKLALDGFEQDLISAGNSVVANAAAAAASAIAAAQAAASASASASTASASASTAAAAAVQAGLAASVAGAPIYPDTTTGLAATAEGGMFFTPQGGGGLRVWREVSGVAVHAGYVGPTGRISPLEFGAKGDGLAEDGPALNLVFAALRAAALTGKNPVVEGFGLEFYTSISVNATAIQGSSSTIWNWRVQNITIIGACAGKPVLDCIGTRGGRWDNVLIWGDRTNRPTVGWQFARAATPPFDFCDHHVFVDCHVDGFFTTGSRHLYGQERSAHFGCSWWNRDICGTTSIIVGHSDPVPMFSDYLAPMVGATSMISNSYHLCEDRSVFWEEGRNHAISNISNTFPAVVFTTAPHNFVPGEKVSIWIVNGMDRAFDAYNGVVGAVTSNTFEIAGFDATALAAYVGSGYATRPQTGPTTIMGRIDGASFYDHYFVNIGTDAVQWVFPDTHIPTKISFGSLVEGSPNSHVRFKPPNMKVTILGFTWETEQRRVHLSVLAVDSATIGQVRLMNGSVKAHTAPYTSRTLVSSPTRFSFKNQDLYAPLYAEIPVGNFANLEGTVYAADLNGVHHYGNTYLDRPTVRSPLFADSSGASWQVADAGGSFVPANNLGKNLGGYFNRVAEAFVGRLNVGSTNTDGVIFETGSASPNGALTAYPGSYYSQTDGATAVLWFKKSGTGNTGWVAIA